jgi:hypothetical protein
VEAINRDNTASWTYTTATFRAKNNNINNSTSFIVGWADCFFEALAHQMTNCAATSTIGNVGFGVDSTTVADALCSQTGSQPPAGASQLITCLLRKAAPLGFHYVCPLERAIASSTVTWHGDNPVSSIDRKSVWAFSLEM